LYYEHKYNLTQTALQSQLNTLYFKL